MLLPLQEKLIQLRKGAQKLLSSDVQANKETLKKGYVLLGLLFLMGVVAISLLDLIGMKFSMINLEWMILSDVGLIILPAAVEGKLTRAQRDVIEMKARLQSELKT